MQFILVIETLMLYLKINNLVKIFSNKINYSVYKQIFF